MKTQGRPRLRRTALVGAAGIAVAVAGCSSNPAPAPTSTTSTPTYAQTINGGNDPAYTTGFDAVKSFNEVASSNPSSPEIPAGAAKYATADFIAAATSSNQQFWKTLQGGPVGRFEAKTTYAGWHGVVLNLKTQQMPWHMELGVCQTTTAKVFNKTGKLIGSGPQTRLLRYTLKSLDQGKTWLLSQQQFVPSQVPLSKYDPSCSGNLNNSSPSSTSHTS